MRLELHVHHHYPDYRLRALIAELLRPIIQRENELMALSARLQAAVDAANAGVALANNKLEAVAAALASSADIAAAAAATAMAKVGVDEDAAAEAINSARVSVQEHIDAVFAKIGVPQPIPVPPVPVPAEPLVFATPDLATATTNKGYNGEVVASGGTGAIRYSSSPPSDNGIMLNSDGTFSGAPAETRDVSFAITATDSASPPVTADINVTIHVEAEAAPAPEPLVLTTTLPNGTVGESYTSSLGITGGTPPFSVSSSPPSDNGVAIDGTGGVAGTPVAAQDSSFAIVVTDSGSPMQRAEGTATLHVEAAPVAETTQGGGAGDDSLNGGTGDDKVGS